ncbi:flagellar C1a complex subunit C1a-32-domain-containing protein [Polychytrium aggregatum]|uniref:flagellar C1a complex subunit C1a-32-domain-containing protein n=1 Tax=Polychytrium aggregatum TaxID=110093 RepID=UPI0022FF3E09|nr:flagellar C1a complex subunit C1a-32-domain-containing protein [Polychytrium aggregatum]KAI9207250.1 flagellar C1a complex subunit C1a-32-domain-containing protein [Polychytrium aggregatum]
MDLRKDLSMRQIYDFYGTNSSDEGIKYLATVFEIDQESERSGILLDFYYYNLSFARHQKFTPDKTSAFFSIMKQTHNSCTASPFLNLQKDYEAFKGLLLKHSVHRPPYSQKVFSLEDVKIISEYARNTYFRHYLMYKYAFTKKLKLDLVVDNLDITPVALSTESLPGKIEGEVESTQKIETSAANPSELQATVVQPAQTAVPLVADVLEATQVAPPAANPPPVVEAQPEALPSDSSEKPILSQQEIVAEELRSHVMTILSGKIDELKSVLMGKLTAQEDVINQKIKKIEEREEEKKKDPKAAKKK